MSADNYNYIFKNNGGFVVEMRFASFEYDEEPGSGGKWFATFKEANEYAHSDWTEYGVQYGFEVTAT